eukprot:TRINITY_DN11774_c0_g4_i1.p1 TRINITY_DN11774_c0_g4~~TRINITY_DN11774_c0_g4_i1.p1  ORF type:complete len:142 (+),score=6.03 TRINITY_DN11774_c0_g4_i1:542-967(+)
MCHLSKRLMYGLWCAVADLSRADVCCGYTGPAPELVDELLPLMQKHIVDVYFHGHDHSLQHLVLKQPKSGARFVIFGAGGYDAHPELERAAAGYPNRQIIPVFRKAVDGFVTAELSAEEAATLISRKLGPRERSTSCQTRR